jgi:hypothetical protein
VEEMNIYRFVNFTQLQSLFNDGIFILRRPVLWEDKWEGFPFKILDNSSGRQKISEYFKQENIPFNRDIIAILKNTIYCLCFTKLAESETLWNTYYNHYEVARIEVNKDVFIKNFVVGIYREFLDVEYVPESQITESYLLNLIISKIVFRDGIQTKTIPTNGYRFKIKERYQWEDECRFLIYEPKNLTMKSDHLKQKVFNIQPEMNLENGIIKDKIELKILKPLNEIIKSILVHPHASDSFCNKVKSMCKIAKVPYLGRSKIRY